MNWTGWSQGTKGVREDRKVREREAQGRQEQDLHPTAATSCDTGPAITQNLTLWHDTGSVSFAQHSTVLAIEKLLII